MHMRLGNTRGLKLHAGPAVVQKGMRRRFIVGLVMSYLRLQIRVRDRLRDGLGLGIDLGLGLVFRVRVRVSSSKSLLNTC